MKLTKTLPALFALALLCGCASQKTGDETTAAAEQKDGGCCKAGQSKATCTDSAKCEAAKQPAQKN